MQGFIDGANKAFATGDTQMLRKFTARACTCLKLAKTVENAWSHGSIRGAAWTLKSTHIVETHGGVATISFVFDEAAYDVVKDGKVESRYGADRVTVFSQFVLDAGVWRLAEFDRDKVEPR